MTRLPERSLGHRLLQALASRPLRKVAVTLLAYGLVSAGAFTGSRSGAQDFPTDRQIQAAFAAEYNHVGLIEYCADKGYATSADVAAARLELKTVVAGFDVAAETREHEVQGRRGEILGKQIIGLMNPDSRTHPEVVPEGRTMSLADNARAQNITERTLCGQMAAQEQVQTAGLRAR